MICDQFHLHQQSLNIWNGSWANGSLNEYCRDLMDASLEQYVRGRSTTHALIDITHKWHQALDKGLSVRALFIDYAKAFDHVDHSLVISRLKYFGIPDFIVKWVFSFLSCRKQRVKLEEVFSEWVELNGGMPQGTWLGPLCYILLIDSLKLQCAVHKFVDDTTLSELIARGVPSAMMDYVHDLLLWSEENKMKINTKKTKEMIIGTLNKNPPALVIN